MKVLKVCFVLDCTASMTPWIDASKNKIYKLLKELCESHKNFTIYVSFIGYRDFGEVMYKVDFTTNIQHIHNVIEGIHADGGNDQAEDVAGAYSWLTSLDWTSNVRAIFHITDAPNHGFDYHEDYVEDDYPDGNPVIDLCEEVEILAYNGIDLTVFRLNETTDKMYLRMQNIYSQIRPVGFRIVNFVNSSSTPDDTLYQEVSSQLIASMSSFT